MAKALKTHLDCTPKEDALARCVGLTSKSYSECYTTAGYADNGEFNRNSAYAILQKSHVAQRLDYYRAKQTKKLDVRDDRIIAEFAAVAFLDPLEVFDIPENGKLTVRTLEDIPPWARRAIASMKLIEKQYGSGKDKEIETSIEVKFHPKIAALTKLAEINNMFEKNNRSKAPQVALTLGYRDDAKPKE